MTDEMDTTRRQHVLAAAMAVAAIVTIITVVVGPWRGRPVPESTGGSAMSEPAPPPGDTRGAHLIVSPASVPLGADVALILANPGRTETSFGPSGTLERWQGGSWRPFRQVTTSLGANQPAGGLHDLDEEIMVPAIALVAGARSFGEPVWTSVQGVDAGWYRFGLGGAHGIVRVGAPDSSTITRPSGEVVLGGTTVVEAGTPGELSLSPQLREPGSGVQPPIEEVVGRYTSGARVERLEDGRWETLPSDTIGTADAVVDSPTTFGVSVPALEPGVYRVGRDTSGAGTAEALFWAQPLS
ncbi:hypothetical protein [Kineosporia succinea]|uniref:Bacterial Ig domain-containing protein n=1 Tax=Kineosporia succinea TaxID=84632 RepID=A0ABT9P9J7_9ACTN|nr:hypothetical protein [Kineosporia succinea]MDP9829142.1 hypothetical protein [Kineosporia succinea]